ncbi:MAG: hypothetical protein HY318_01720 [Armatimonadetes bacterium]|nr:hypothetical protein [Armatimonadota bacterium]
MRSQCRRTRIVRSLALLIAPAILAWAPLARSAPGERSLHSREIGVSFDERGRMILGRRPVFPIGIYVALAPHRLTSDRKGMLAILDDLRNSPFKILVNYGSPDGALEERRRFLDQLHKRGLCEFFSLKDYYVDLRLSVRGLPEYGKTDEEVLRKDVRALKDHPAILGWYISDERQDVESVRRHHQWVKQEDPFHPTLHVGGYSCISLPFADAADIIGVDQYPVTHERPWAITEVADIMDELQRKICRGQRPAWTVVQAVGGYLWNEDVRERGYKFPPDEALKYRAPTPREIRCMTYLALTHGATGLLYYYHKEIKVAYDSEVRWSAVKSIAKEVRDLSTVLLAPDYEPGKITGDNPKVHWKAKSRDGKLFVIAVNSSTEVQGVILTLPGPAQKAVLRTGIGLAYPWKNQLLLILDGYEAVAVELS